MSPVPLTAPKWSVTLADGVSYTLQLPDNLTSTFSAYFYPSSQSQPSSPNAVGVFYGTDAGGFISLSINMPEDSTHQPYGGVVSMNGWMDYPDEPGQQQPSMSLSYLWLPQGGVAQPQSTASFTPQSSR